MSAVNISTSKSSGSHMLGPLNGKCKDAQTWEDDGKTYVIIVRDNKSSVPNSSLKSSHVKQVQIKDEISPAPISQLQSPAIRVPLKRSSKDSVKKNLANICDESEDEELYTSSADLAEMFGVSSSKEHSEKEAETICRGVKTRFCGKNIKVSEDVKPFCKRPHLARDLTHSPADTEAHSTLSRKLFASPPPGNDSSEQFTVLSNKTPSDSTAPNNCTVTPDFIRHAYKTPTPELPLNKLGAVRKIFVVHESPSCPKSSTPTPKSARKTVNSPRLFLTPKTPSCSTPLSSPRIVSSRSKNDGKSPQTTVIQITNIPQSKDWKVSEQLTASNTGGKSTNLNDSLTNIHWLGGLASEGLVPKNKTGEVPSGKEIERVSMECGRQKRPSFSYMMLIRMAMNSRENKRMTLREICKWIEDTFPFYKHTAKPGWRNSIRHNLSVYDIFVRVPTNPKQHGSQWTVKESNSKKTKYSKSSQNKDASGSHNYSNTSIPTHVLSSLPFMNTGGPSLGMNTLSMQAQNTAQSQQGLNKKKAKKGPTPILPRPPVMLRNSSVMPPGGALQTYALIPISSLSSALQPSTSQITSMVSGQTPPVTVSLPADSASLPNQNLLLHGRDQSTVATSVNSGTSTEPCYNDERPPFTCNVIKEAWETAGCMDTEDTHMCESIDSEEQPSKRSKVKPGLPVPKMYSNSKPKPKPKPKPKGRKTVKKGKSLQRNSTPVKCGPITESQLPVNHDGLISESQLDHDIENGLPTPLRELLDTPAAEPEASSTPSKCLTDSPKWLSPIAGFTPGRGGLPDGSFLDFLPNNLDCDSPTIVTPVKSQTLEAWLKIATGLLDTPNTSLLQVNPVDLSPFRAGGGELDTQHSISHLLAEIDPCLMDELDNLSSLH